MVSVQYGGGPSLEQRRAFCETRGHVPGYSGFVPHAKFETGSTYGQETYDATKKVPYYSGPKNPAVKNIYAKVGKSKDCDSRFLFKDEICTYKLPIPTGDNKYTEKMIPGYSGDIPHWNYKFGTTYRSSCDAAVDEFINDYERNQKKAEDTQKMANMFPKLRSICKDLRVRDHMNLWCDQLMRTMNRAADKRESLEPPIPGYTGFIARKSNTELGLGGRYHDVTAKSLEYSTNENTVHFQRLENKMEVENNTYHVQDHKLLSISAPSQPTYSKRIFTQDGMIAAYTGHMHGMSQVDGYSFSDINRKLDVCKHSSPCYGDYIRNIDLAVK